MDSENRDQVHQIVSGLQSVPIVENNIEEQQNIETLLDPPKIIEHKSPNSRSAQKSKHEALKVFKAQTGSNYTHDKLFREHLKQKQAQSFYIKGKAQTTTIMKDVKLGKLNVARKR